MSKEKVTSIRLDAIHKELLLEIMVYLEEKGVKVNQTEVIQKAIYSFAKDRVPEEKINSIIDKHYTGFFQD